MQITRVSQFTGKTHTREIDITPQQLAEVDNSERVKPIQNFLPHLSDDDREFLLSGATPEEWDRFMPDDDDADGGVMGEPS